METLETCKAEATTVALTQGKLTFGGISHTGFSDRGHSYPWLVSACSGFSPVPNQHHMSSLCSFLSYLLDIKIASLICLGWPPDTGHWFWLRNRTEPIRNAYFSWRNNTHDALLLLRELTNLSTYAMGLTLKRQVSEWKLFFLWGEHLGVIFPCVNSVSSCLTHTKTPGCQTHKLACQTLSIH